MADEPVPTRRIRFTVTGYLRHGHPVGGWYDMQAQPDGGQTYSIPEFEVDESSVKDAPPEQLTDDDWSEIRGHVAGRMGTEAADRLLAQFRSLAVGFADGGPASHSPGAPRASGPGIDMLRSAEEFRQLGEWIRSGEALRMRVDSGLTQSFSAHSIGVTQGALGRWEHDLRVPRGRNAVAYFRFLSELAAAEAARAEGPSR